jgi:hypothetical protein
VADRLTTDTATPNPKGAAPMNGKKTQDTKKNGTLRPWLVDVVVENLR